VCGSNFKKLINSKLKDEIFISPEIQLCSFDKRTKNEKKNKKMGFNLRYIGPDSIWRRKMKLQEES
jgi:hypothetical protein